jgi:hypothetical protein
MLIAMDVATANLMADSDENVRRAVLRLLIDGDSFLPAMGRSYMVQYPAVDLHGLSLLVRTHEAHH